MYRLIGLRTASDQHMLEAVALLVCWTRLYGSGRPLRIDKQPAATGATAGDGGHDYPLLIS